MLKAFIAHCNKNSFFGKQDKLLLAVSGGIDSVVLAHVLKEAGYDFAVAHCNFQLRGKEADKDEQFVKRLAQQLGAVFFAARFETKKYAQQKKLSVQMAARELRYDWFHLLVKENKFSRLVTAHHLNDNLETALLNFTRGTGISGLTGIPEKSGYIVRPLLAFTREEIENFARQNNIRFREDSSNYEEKYARNLIRKKVVPALKKINPSLEGTCRNNIAHLKPVMEIAQDFLAEKTNRYAEKRGEEIYIRLDGLRSEKQFRFILYSLLSHYNFNADQCEMAAVLADALPGKMLESSTHRLVKDRKAFVISAKKTQPQEEIILPRFPAEIIFPVKIKFSIVPGAGFIFPRSKKIACFDLDKLKGKTILRYWKEGDTFRPFGMKGTKKLSDFFVQEKMNRFEKEKALVLESDGKIAWVVGRRADDRFAVTNDTKKILVAELD